MRGKAFLSSASLGFIGITPAYAGKSTARRRAYLFFWDHPRICGEKPLEEHGGAVITGSPPHMRGKDIRGVVQNVLFGITPAYAGKRPRSTSCFLPCWDHPRICGEKHGPPPRLPLFLGSPPHMRGKAAGRTRRRCYHGITPAYAGKRYSRRCPECPVWDHPRICGEKAALHFLLFAMLGSPPHMRGKVYRCGDRGADGGITPAYAGKRVQHSLFGLLGRDHPRICGEKLFFCWFASARLGSPPHMRGKELPARRRRVYVGITPAYAGKSLASNRAIRGYKDHPRICGEKIFANHSRAISLGSPPHMRGKETLGVIDGNDIGITPAYAGKSSRESQALHRHRDHPRICGEKQT